MKREKFNKFFARIPKQVVIILIMLIWIVPTFGLLITSLRPVQSINSSGWWTILNTPVGTKEYAQYCASCHGKDGKAIATADLTDPELIAKYDRSVLMEKSLQREINGKPHMGELAVPESKVIADIVVHLKNISGYEKRPRVTINNYVDALVGYRGTRTYLADCAAGTPPLDINCNISDIVNPRGMGRAFINSLLVTIPATLLPILFAAFAGYAFSWMHFKGRMLLFAILVGLQV
ncbi:MAG: hypothetical protein ABFD14_10690, partial [Anaerolineaceae bacterium]